MACCRTALSRTALQVAEQRYACIFTAHACATSQTFMPWLQFFTQSAREVKLCIIIVFSKLSYPMGHQLAWSSMFTRFLHMLQEADAEHGGHAEKSAPQEHIARTVHKDACRVGRDRNSS